MILLSVDQSLTHSACCIWQDGVPVHKAVFKTADSCAKEVKKGAYQAHFTVERIQWLCEQIAALAEEWKIDHFVMEDLPFNLARGNAGKDLAGLFYAIELTILKTLGDISKIHTVNVTAAKKQAHNFLPPELAFYEEIKVDKRSGKEHTITKQVKMDKKLMIAAAERKWPGFLDGMNLTMGKADVADALWIGYCWWEGISGSAR